MPLTGLSTGKQSPNRRNFRCGGISCSDDDQRRNKMKIVKTPVSIRQLNLRLIGNCCEDLEVKFICFRNLGVHFTIQVFPNVVKIHLVNVLG